MRLAISGSRSASARACRAKRDMSMSSSVLERAWRRSQLAGLGSVSDFKERRRGSRIALGAT